MIPAQYKKAFTLSFDDGVLQDERLIAILDRLGLRATFNLNSGLLGRPDTLVRNGVTVDHSCFAPQTNLLRFDPTLTFIEFDEMERLGEEFLAAQPRPEDAPLLYYVWGHSYELDAYDAWERFEAFLTRMSGHADVFYGTNREVLLPDGPAADSLAKPGSRAVPAKESQE